ncbi:MAG: EthD domain-containing protein [Pseudomonadota bacterium]
MTAPPGARLTIALTRLPTLTRGEFQAYWRDRHAPLVRSMAEVMGIVGYVQLHVGPDDGGPGAAPFDGLAEVWFASREAHAARMATADARAAARRLREDERRFVDIARSPRWWGQAHRVI